LSHQFTVIRTKVSSTRILSSLSVGMKEQDR
jgi:hypothetical protein